MVAFMFGKLANAVGESQRLREVSEAIYTLQTGDSITLDQAPIGDLRLGSSISADVTRGESLRHARQRCWTNGSICSSLCKPRKNPCQRQRVERFKHQVCRRQLKLAGN